VLTITLTIFALALLAIAAHAAGGRARDARGWLDRLVDSRAILIMVFIATFLVAWCAWGARTPIPVVHDEMAYVLQAQIFARGLWSLPMPRYPLFWEQSHVLVEPVVASKYFPGHSLLLTLGALVGWVPLVPLLLHGGTGVLTVMLARRVSSGGVALASWIIWLSAPMVLYFGPSYYSEVTTTFCWLAGWYALLEWRSSRRLPWLLGVAFLTGWVMITRPLTGLAYAIPVGCVVLRDVAAGARWRALLVATLVGVLVLGILPVWSAHTTGSWRVTPLALYTRMYLPFDVPGFGLVTTPPTHSLTTGMQQLTNIYGAIHVTHVPARLPIIMRERALFLFVNFWAATAGILGVFALLGLLTLHAEAAVSVATAVILFVLYLSYATPPEWTIYYYEATPVLAYLTAAGLAWAAALIGRPRGMPNGEDFRWNAPRWTSALALCSLALLLPGAISLRITRAAHVIDRQALSRFQALLRTIHDPKAVVFVRYAPMHSPHVAFVQNVANPDAAQIWTVFDRGDAENARLLDSAPSRTAYLFDEQSRRTYIYDPRER
jgi:hypothetical protein